MAITVALRSQALTTLQRVLDEIGASTDGGQHDSLLNGYINGASAWLANACGRVFQAQNGIDELLAGFGRTKIRLDHSPIRLVTSAVLDGQTLTQSLNGGGDFQVDDADAGLLYREFGWTWRAGRLPGLDVEGVPGEEKRNIEVVYNGGFITRPQNAVGGVDGDVTFVGLPITLPDDLEDACIQMVSTRWARRGTDRTVTARSFEASGYTFGGAAIPPEVLAVVAQYARVAHA